MKISLFYFGHNITTKLHSRVCPTSQLRGKLGDQGSSPSRGRLRFMSSAMLFSFVTYVYKVVFEKNIQRRQKTIGDFFPFA